MADKQMICPDVHICRKADRCFTGGNELCGEVIDHRKPHDKTVYCSNRGCPACVEIPAEPVQPNLDELMPLVVEPIANTTLLRVWYMCGATKQNDADKTVTAKLLAERDAKIAGLEGRIEGYKRVIDLLAINEQRLNGKLREQLAKYERGV